VKLLRESEAGDVRNIFQKEHWPIALDMGVESIRMIQFRRSGQGVRLVAHDEWRYPESLRGDPAARRAAAVKSVRQTLRVGEFRGRDVVSSLPNESISIQNFRMPISTGASLDSAVRDRATEMSGIPIAGSQFDYIVAGDVRGKGGKDHEQEIISLTASQETVAAHLALLKDMGLSPVRIELDSIAMFHVFETMLRRQEDEGTVTVAMDLGAKASRLILACGGKLLFLKSIGIGSDDLTQAVADHGNLDLAQAMELRTTSAKELSQLERLTGDSHEVVASESIFWMLRDAMRGPLEQLAKEIQLCLRYCSVTFRGIRPDVIDLCGGQARDGLVVRLLTEAVGMECRLFNPFSRPDLAEALALGAGEMPGAEWTVAGGLAIGMMEADRNRKERNNDPRRLSA
jgi:type IV pilus assembly protein PilM